jgi:hypothetical protein
MGTYLLWHPSRKNASKIFGAWIFLRVTARTYLKTGFQRKIGAFSLEFLHFKEFSNTLYCDLNYPGAAYYELTESEAQKALNFAAGLISPIKFQTAPRNEGLLPVFIKNLEKPRIFIIIMPQDYNPWWRPRPSGFP